jgi:antitoxin HicB
VQHGRSSGRPKLAHTCDFQTETRIFEAIKTKKIFRNNLAQKMKASRSPMGKLLYPKDETVTITTLQRTAIYVGRKLRFELV